MPRAGTEFHGLISTEQIHGAAETTASSGPDGVTQLVKDVVPLQALAQAHALKHIPSILADPGTTLVGTFLWAFECGVRAAIGDVEDSPFTVPVEWLEKDPEALIETLKLRLASGDKLFLLAGADRIGGVDA